MASHVTNLNLPKVYHFCTFSLSYHPHAIHVQGQVVVQHSQLCDFCDALAQQRRFGFCFVPVPPTSLTPPALPESMRLPMPGDAGDSGCQRCEHHSHSCAAAPITQQSASHCGPVASEDAHCRFFHLNAASWLHVADKAQPAGEDAEEDADPTALKGVAVAWSAAAVYYLPFAALSSPAASAPTASDGGSEGEWRQRVAAILGSSAAEKVINGRSYKLQGSSTWQLP